MIGIPKPLSFQRIHLCSTCELAPCSGSKVTDITRGRRRSPPEDWHRSPGIPPVSPLQVSNQIIPRQILANCLLLVVLDYYFRVQALEIEYGQLHEALTRISKRKPENPVEQSYL
jgi:hypothetical protein